MKTVILAAAAVLAISTGIARAESGEFFGWDTKPAAGQAPAGTVINTAQPQAMAGTVIQTSGYNGNG